MKKKLLLLLLIYIPFFINAKEIKIDWSKSNIDEGYFDYTMLEYDDGSVVVGTNTDSTQVDGLELNGKKDAIIIKYDSKGNLIWKKLWGGSGDDSLIGYVKTPDGGFAAVGNTDSEDMPEIEHKGHQDGVLVKFDKNGNVEWQKAFGDNQNQYMNELLLTSDGNYITLGSNSEINEDRSLKPSDILITTFDNKGNILLQKKYGGSKTDSSKKSFLTKDNELIVFFISLSNDMPGVEYKNAQDIYMMKLSKQGEIIWVTNFGGNGYDSVETVKETENGYIILSSSTSSDIPGTTYVGGVDVLITKIDKNGNIIWQRIWGGTGSDYISDISELNDGSYIMVGNTYSTDINGLNINGSADASIVKYDQNGNLLWQKNWGGTDFDNFKSVIVNNSIIVAGMTKSTDIANLTSLGSNDIVLLEYDLDGNIQQYINYGGSKDDTVLGISKANDGSYYLRIQTASTDIPQVEYINGNNILLSKFHINYALLLNENISYGTATAIQQGLKGMINPTPENGYKVDKVIVKDTQGKEIETKLEQDGTYSFDLYDDVTIEVLFALAVDNPKTGIMDFITIIFIGFVISLSGFFLVKNYNERLEI